MNEKFPTENNENQQTGEPTKNWDGLDDPAVPRSELGLPPITEVPSELINSEGNAPNNVIEFPVRNSSDTEMFDDDHTGLNAKVTSMEDVRRANQELEGKNPDGIIVGVPDHLKNNE